LVNETFPEKFEFINKELKLKDIKSIVDRIFIECDIDETAKILDKIKNIGFKYATVSGISWGMDDLTIPKEKGGIIADARKKVDVVEGYYGRGLVTEGEKRIGVIEIWKDAIDKIGKVVPQTLDHNGSVFSMVDSKARASWSQINQMMGLKGLVQNPAGDIIDLPIISSFKEGFNVLEYFISTHGARKGTADTALRTAQAGYLTRRLVDVSQDVVITENDCGDTEGFEMKRKDSEEFGLPLGTRIFSRTILKDIKDAAGKVIIKAGEIIDVKKSELIDENGVSEAILRSPITCKAKFGICQKCYGYNLEIGRAHV
jgi:DNA-directed RNA polymerase subunit beta'